MNNSQYRMDYDDYSTAKGRESEVSSKKSPFKLQQSHSVSDEADTLAKAISQATAAAKSIILSGGSLETASSTAKAAASSVLNPSRSTLSGISGRHLLSRRHAKQQAAIIAAMALVTAKKEIDDQRNSAARAFRAADIQQRGNTSSIHTSTASISSNMPAAVPNSNAGMVKKTRGIMPQLAAPLFQSDTDTDAGSETDWPSSPLKNERRQSDSAKESASQYGLEKKTALKQDVDVEHPKERNEAAPKSTSLFFRRKKLTSNPSDEEREIAARRAAPKDGQFTQRKQQDVQQINTTHPHPSTSRAPEGSYFDSCSYDDGSEDLSYDPSFAEDQSRSRNVTDTALLPEDGCLMASIAHVFSCVPTKAPKSRPSLSAFTQEARDDQANPRMAKSRDESRVGRKEEETNDTQDILRELNASRPHSTTMSGRPSPMRESMEKIVMGVLTTPTVASSHKKAFPQRISRGGRQAADADLSNLSTDGASEISTFSRASRMRLWSGRRKKVEQPE